MGSIGGQLQSDERGPGAPRLGGGDDDTGFRTTSLLGDVYAPFAGSTRLDAWESTGGISGVLLLLSDADGSPVLGRFEPSPGRVMVHRVRLLTSVRLLGAVPPFAAESIPLAARRLPGVCVPDPCPLTSLVA